MTAGVDVEEVDNIFSLLKFSGVITLLRRDCIAELFVAADGMLASRKLLSKKKLSPQGGAAGDDSDDRKVLLFEKVSD